MLLHTWWADTSGALTWWQHFSAWNDGHGHHLENGEKSKIWTLQSMLIYLKNIRAKFDTDPISNDGAVGFSKSFFAPRTSTRTTRTRWVAISDQFLIQIFHIKYWLWAEVCRAEVNIVHMCHQRHVSLCCDQEIRCIIGLYQTTRVLTGALSSPSPVSELVSLTPGLSCLKRFSARHLSHGLLSVYFVITPPCSLRLSVSVSKSYW